MLNETMTELSLDELDQVSGGNPVSAVVSAARAGWAIGSAIYDRYDTQIQDAIDYVLN